MRELRTQLEIAIQNQDVQHIAQRLSSGDTPQDPNHLGIPVLYDALKSNNLEILELLCKYKLKLNIPYNQNGYTPLIYACLYCKLETVKWLLSKGLSINDTTPLGAVNCKSLNTSTINRQIFTVKQAMENHRFL